MKTIQYYLPALTQNSPIIASGLVVGVCVSEASISTSAFFRGNCSIGYKRMQCQLVIYLKQPLPAKNSYMRWTHGQKCFE